MEMIFLVCCLVFGFLCHVLVFSKRGGEWKFGNIMFTAIFLICLIIISMSLGIERGKAMMDEKESTPDYQDYLNGKAKMIITKEIGEDKKELNDTIFKKVN